MKAMRRMGSGLAAAALLLAACGPAVPAAPTALPPTLVFPTRAPTRIPTLPAPQPTEAALTPEAGRSGGSADDPVVLAGLDPSTPEDVIAEMYEFGGGAGGSANCVRPPAQDSLLETRLPDTVILQFCWDDPDASVRLTVTTPDLQKEVYELPVKQDGEERYLIGLYPVDLSRPAGLYHFRLAGEQHQVAFSLRFAPAELPVVYEVLEMTDEWQFEGSAPHHRLHLAGFAPNEPLRLLVYHVQSGMDGLIGWQSAAAGPDGQVWVDFHLEEELASGWLAVIAAGPESGEVHMLTPFNSSKVGLSAWTAVCPGTLPSRLNSLLAARVLRDLDVYEEPSAGSAPKGRLSAGTSAGVYSGPYCREGARWWFIAAGEVLGYTPEAAGGEYLLEPAPVE